VVLYELLAGKMPFLTDSMRPLDWLKLHKTGPKWSPIQTSEASKSLCRRLLTFKESHRPSMEEALKDEWFTLQEYELLTVSPAQIADLEAFCREAAVKRAVMFEIASRLPMEKAQKIVEVFETFDADRSGSVSLEELRSAFQDLGLRDHMAEKTFQALDVDRDGSLSFSELAAGILVLFRDILEERLHALFLERWDGQGEGLDSEGLRAFFESAVRLRSVSGAKSSEILRAVERSGRRRRVSFEELRDHILGVPHGRL